MIVFSLRVEIWEVFEKDVILGKYVFFFNFMIYKMLIVRMFFFRFMNINIRSRKIKSFVDF